MRRTPMKLAGAAGLAALVALTLGSGPRRGDTDLRVCADPYNLPFSIDRGEGFENKIAQLVATDPNAPVVHSSWPDPPLLLRTPTPTTRKTSSRPSRRTRSTSRSCGVPRRATG